jgi:hypothetical protein
VLHLCLSIFEYSGKLKITEKAASGVSTSTTTSLSEAKVNNCFYFNVFIRVNSKTCTPLLIEEQITRHLLNVKVVH